MGGWRTTLAPRDGASRDPNPAPSARRVSRTARGGIRGVQDFGKQFRALAKGAGIQNVRIHDLRHAGATILMTRRQRFAGAIVSA